MTKKAISIIFVFFMFLTTSFASAYKSFSSGQIGCSEKDIEVSDLDQSVTSETLTATCKGKRYFCSRTGNLGTSAKQVSCKEEAH